MGLWNVGNCMSTTALSYNEGRRGMLPNTDFHTNRDLIRTLKLEMQPK